MGSSTPEDYIGITVLETIHLYDRLDTFMKGFCFGLCNQILMALYKCELCWSRGCLQLNMLPKIFSQPLLSMFCLHSEMCFSLELLGKRNLPGFSVKGYYQTIWTEKLRKILWIPLSYETLYWKPLAHYEKRFHDHHLRWKIKLLQK